MLFFVLFFFLSKWQSLQSPEHAYVPLLWQAAAEITYQQNKYNKIKDINLYKF